MKHNTTKRTFRVLMHNRANALTHPGGDTVVMLELKRCLEGKGHTVDVDLEGVRTPSDYDLVHLFNLSTAQLTEFYARRAVEHQTPFVVTAMYEDWPLFFHQMFLQFEFLQQYIVGGQKQYHQRALEHALQNVAPRQIQNNSYTIQHAASIIVTGEAEAEAIQRDYPSASNIDQYRCGFQFQHHSDGGRAFEKEYGIKDFVLCVGRLETRKNQLMLLKALEHSELPLVFASGGVGYQPEYESLARSFQRKGPTVFLPRLTPELMASVYGAAKVHVLPSWYELPGLVSLEAAAFEKNIVVTDYGTARDYFGESAFYCRPDDPDSILNAVTAAYYAPLRTELAERVAQFTWEEATRQVVNIYDRIIRQSAWEHPVIGTMESVTEEVKEVSASISALSRAIPDTPEEEDRLEKAVELVEEADRLAKSGESQKSLKLYHDAAQLSPTFARAQRGIGVVHLTSGKLELASAAFRRALILDPEDFLSRTGYGATLWEEGKQVEAFEVWQEVLSAQPTELTAILYFINACYSLHRLSDLQRVLEKYRQVNSKNTELNFCLAGCLFKQGKLDQAENLAQEILMSSPEHAHTQELRSLIAEKRSEAKTLTCQVEMERVVRSSSVSSFGEMIRRIEEAHRQKQYDEALSEIARIESSTNLSINEEALLKTLRGEALACKGKLTEAESEFCQAEGDSECGYRAITGRGVIAASLGKWEEAEQFFNKALLLSERGDVALAGLGLCSMTRGEQERAWEYFQQSLAINPENKRAIFGVLQLGYAMNRLADLERALRAYLAMNPVDLGMLYSYAGCLYAQKRYGEAQKELQKIRLFEPENALAVELLEKIQEECPQTVNA